METRSDIAQDDRHDERSACKSELDWHWHCREEDWNGSEQYTKCDADEGSEELWLVESLHRVTNERMELLNVVLVSHDGQSVAKLKDERWLGDELRAGTTHTRDGDIERLAELEVAETTSVELRVGDHESLRYELVVLCLVPLLLVHLVDASSE